MNDRQKQLLSAIVELYTKTAVPVGSQALIEHYNFGLSSATLRNDWHCCLGIEFDNGREELFLTVVHNFFS